MRDPVRVAAVLATAAACLAIGWVVSAWLNASFAAITIGGAR